MTEYNQIFAMSAMIGLVGYIFADYMQIYLRYRGAVNSKIASGYSNAMKSMVGMRMGAVIYTFLVAISVERGIQTNFLIGLYAIALPCCAVPIAFMVPRLKRNSGVTHELSEQCSGILWQPLVVSAAAITFNLLGLAIPFVAGSKFPEWRLTLAQSSIFFNVFYTILTVFFIENRFAKLVDANDPKYHSFTYSVTLGRVIGCAFGGIILSTLFVIQ